MPVSLYCSARREAPIETAEQTSVDAIITRYNRGREIETRRVYGPEALELEGIGAFSLFKMRVLLRPEQPLKPLFAGSLELPLTDQLSIVERILAYWCEAFTELRRTVEAPVWHVNLDDHEIPWNEQAKRYDPMADRSLIDSYVSSRNFVRRGR